VIAWLIGGVGALVLVASLVFLAFGFNADRSAADRCWESGGVPVQGDSVAGNPVVCLDSSVLIEVSS